MDVTELLKESESNFDSKNILNKGLGKVSKDIIEQIENSGITSELLDQFPFPIFKYRTQITLHGTFENQVSITYQSTGGYKNLIVNKNKSLGVRYSAIDIHKKKLIGNILRLENSPYRLSLDSQSCYLLSYLTYSGTNLETMKQAFKLLPTNYIGFSQLYVSASLYGKFIVIRLVLNAIYEREFYQFLATLLQKDYSEQIYKANLAIKEEAERLENLERQKQREQEQNNREGIFKTSREDFIKAHPIKYLHTLANGRYLYFTSDYSDAFKVNVLHIFQAKNKMLMNYSEAVRDINSIPETDTHHYSRKQLKEHRLNNVNKRLATDFYFKLAS